MGTPLPVFLFLIVLIQLFNVHQAAESICTTTGGGYYKTIPAPTVRRLVWSPIYRRWFYYNVAVGSPTNQYVPGKVTSYCCPGYNKINDNPLTCVPTCLEACTNGICSSPNVCGCKSGYKLDLNNKYNCLPICSTPCGNGTCTAPEKCLCTKGYTFANKTCQPVCSKPCANGTCIAPDTCQCLPGFQKSEENICVPHCSSGCQYGTCVSPETCVCNSGFGIMNKTCQPICTKPCINGTCVAPETCQCTKGYVTSDEYSCKPYCSSGCPHGSCVGPETCVCDIGWRMVVTNITMKEICQPICTKPCVNGTCVAPDTCKCLTGYTTLEKNICEPLCTGGCSHGTCVSPGTCSCDPGWYRSNLNGTCVEVTDTIKFDKNTGVKDWFSNPFDSDSGSVSEADTSTTPAYASTSSKLANYPDSENEEQREPIRAVKLNSYLTRRVRSGYAVQSNPTKRGEYYIEVRISNYHELEAAATNRWKHSLVSFKTAVNNDSPTWKAVTQLVAAVKEDYSSIQPILYPQNSL